MSTNNTKYSDQAFVLHTRNYRNTSLITEVFTRGYGRLSMVAKGARQNRSRLYSLIQPFNRLQVTWGGHGEMQTLYTAEPEGATFTLLKDALYSGMYINELLIRLLHRHDPHPELFDTYQNCLQKLVDNQDIDIHLRYFELSLLEQLGYGVNLQFDRETGDNIQAEYNYTYFIEQGPGKFIDQEADNTLLVSGQTLLKLQQHCLDDEVSRKQARALTRAILDHYLGHKPLMTRELIRSRKKTSASTSSND